MAKTTKKLIKKEERDAIVAQCIDEISHARLYKRDIVADWQKNEDIINDRTSKGNSARSLQNPQETRANVALHKATGFVQTVLSKIDTPLSFTFEAQHEGDIKSAKLFNALVAADRETDNWDFKDILAKKSAIIYGRAIFSYYAESSDGYKANLNNIDPYDFLTDPNTGGIDIQNARYCGAYNIRFDRYELEQGLKNGRFLKTETTELLSGTGNNDESTQEQEDKTNRYAQFSIKNRRKEKYDPDLFKFWNWYTTYKGERYYVVLSETHGTALRIEKLKDITESNLWPFWSYAVFPDAAEFWTESYVSIVREIFMAQNASINQMLNNADQINNPQRAIDVGAILDESELRFKRNGKIRFKRGTNIDQAYKILETPSIDTPIAVYETLENIVQLMSGVTGAIQGVAEEDKVGIYEGNISATSDRFNLLNKSYSNGYRQFATLYKYGVQEHLKKKQAVKIIGPKGVEVENINYKSISPLGDYIVSVSATASESQTDFREKRERISMLDKYAGTDVINAKNAFEMEAEIMGFSPSDIRRLTDPETTYRTEIISEAARDIELVISGKKILPNEIADIAYLQYLADYMRDKQENISMKQFMDLSDYFNSVKPIAVRNMVYSVQDELAKQGKQSGQLSELPEEEEPLDVPEEENQQLEEVDMQEQEQQLLQEQI